MVTIPDLAPQPQFPQISLNVTPQGLIITIQLSGTTNISQLIAAEAMDNIVKMWREMRKNQGNEMDIIRAINSTRNG